MSLLPILLRALVAWVAIILAETVHGAIRRALVESWIGIQRASQLGLVLGIVIILVVAIASARWIGARRAGPLLAIGAMWVVLTLLVEIGLAAVAGDGWERLSADYDLLHGGLMPLGLLVMLATPLLAARLTGLRPGRPTRRTGLHAASSKWPMLAPDASAWPRGERKR